MAEWIPFEEGRYRVERALVMDEGERAVALEDTVIDVAQGPGGRLRMSGRGRVRNALLVRLLDEADDFDLLLDLGGAFRYRMRRPAIQGGKVFAAGVKSFIQFVPQSPWEVLAEEEFNSLIARIRILDAEED